MLGFNPCFYGILSSITLLCPMPHRLLVSILVFMESFLQYRQDRQKGRAVFVSILVFMESFLQSPQPQSLRPSRLVSILVFMESFLQSLQALRSMGVFAVSILVFMESFLQSNILTASEFVAKFQSLFLWNPFFN